MSQVGKYDGKIRSFLSCRLTSTNTFSEYLQPEIGVTDLLNNRIYVTCDNISRLVVIGIIPLILLTYWNYNIYKHTKITSVSLAETINEQVRRKQEKELANILIGIVIVFLLCHSQRQFISVHEIVAYDFSCRIYRKYYFTVWGAIATNFYVLTLAINSSLNTVIYFFLTSKFWKNLFQM